LEIPSSWETPSVEEYPTRNFQQENKISTHELAPLIPLETFQPGDDFF
jgi:hypothetical protein